MINDETREAVLNALQKSRHALDEAERLLDHQPPPKGEIPIKPSARGQRRTSSLVFMSLGVIILVACVVFINVWWVRHTWK